MKNQRVVIILISLFMIAVRQNSYAVDSLTHKYPSAVLVELRTEQSRVKALIADRKYKELDEVKGDLACVHTAMIRDFNDHFNYCPVYYFIDTNEDLVLKKEFDGVLLIAEGTPAQKVVINAFSKDYVIVYYGYPAEQRRNQKVVTDSAKYESNSGEPMGEGLIINNDKMQQVNYLYNLGYDVLVVRKKDKPYYYSSRHFHIGYYPSANDFNEKLKLRKNTHRIKMNRRLG